MSTIAETTDQKPSWKTSPCPNWCEWEHFERELPGDRHHAGKTFRRALSLEDPTEVEPGQYEPQYVAAYLWQHVREIEPTITVCKGESSEGFRLTLEDADVLAALLHCLVAEGRGLGSA